jgi:PIN domain nuclease of toxin-antitoxin system
MAGGRLMLLDTCALLWLAEGGDRLSKQTRERIDAAPTAHISAITGFEIGMKYRSGKLELPALPSEWLRVVLDHHDIAVVPLDISICVGATELPTIHRDPCDRLIISTAKILGWPIVTADTRFQAYDVEIIC